jgi:hypothetical protein|tara:strand:+ start:11502 stop:11810 length:309 start_codon:yes stop_codon:yes gene_type:complete
MIFSANTIAATNQEQPKIITGKILDANGISLPGVNVLLKNTSKGVITDFDGHYSIQVDSDKALLVFSYLGFQTKEILVGNQLTINVTLKEEMAELDEIVIVG